MYVEVRLVCPRIGAEGRIDLQAFHASEGRKYLAAYFLVTFVTIGTNALFADATQLWSTQNYAVIPMAISTLAAAIFISTRWIQYAAFMIQCAMWLWYFTALQPPLAG